MSKHALTIVGWKAYERNSLRGFATVKIAELDRRASQPRPEFWSERNVRCRHWPCRSWREVTQLWRRDRRQRHQGND
jgi:hypothetical protein